MDFRKGQTGVEYLTMYAIAFMIVLVVILVLYYMFSTPPVTPRCDFPVDLMCVDYKLNTSGNLTLILKQSTGHPITVTAWNCTENENLAGITTPLNSSVFINSGSQQLVINGTPCYRTSGQNATGHAGNVYSGRMFIVYNETDTGFVHVLTGNIVAKYE